jgi:hypothetical protein
MLKNATIAKRLAVNPGLRVVVKPSANTTPFSKPKLAVVSSETSVEPPMQTHAVRAMPKPKPYDASSFTEAELLATVEASKPPATGLSVCGYTTPRRRW